MTPEDETPSSVYGAQVAAINDAQPRNSTFQPATPVELYIKNRRAPKSVAELSPIELEQFRRMWPGKDLDRLLQFGDEEEGMPLDIELATVVDAAGEPRYLLWACNYGVVFLMEASRVECVAFASQHVVEYWHADQRDLFWAMDRAMGRRDHGVQQSMRWGWWEDARWAAIADKPRGTVASEPYVRKQFAAE